MLHLLKHRWRGLWRYTLIVQCGLLLGTAALLLIGYDSAPTRLVAALSNSVVPVRAGRLVTSVRNVFGDTVAGATVTIDGKQTTAEADGGVELDDISLGWHVMRVEANGYHPLSQKLRIGEGDNEPLVKNENGLWPVGFAVDFHVFYARDEPVEQRLFIQIGLANGSDLPIYIYDLFTTDASGHRLDTLLAAPSGYERVALMYPHISLAAEPLALVLKPKGFVILELPPLQMTPVPTKAFFVTVKYASHDEPRSGPTETIQLQQHAAWEPDLSPHRP